MDEQLEKLILEQIREIHKICSANQLRLERMDESMVNMKSRQERDEAALSEELKIIEDRITKIEKFQIKLVAIATTVAFVITLIWELASKLVLPLVM